MSGEVRNRGDTPGGRYWLVKSYPFTCEEQGPRSSTPAGEIIDERVAHLLDSASLLLYAAPSCAATTIAVTTLLTDEPPEAAVVWRYCRRLAEQRGLRVSAILRGQALTLRFGRPVR